MRPAFSYFVDTVRGAFARAPLSVYGLLICTMIVSVGLSGRLLVRGAADPVDDLMMLGDGGRQSVGGLSAVQTASSVLENDDWTHNLRTQFQERGRSTTRQSNLGVNVLPSKSSPPGTPLSFARPLDSNDEDELPNTGGAGRTKTHRTMCVRLCDGYFFPISFSTTSNRFDDDEAACARSCTSPAKLYVYRNPGEEPEDMVNLKGQPYTKLPTAFRFRTKLDQACKCNLHPWEPEAMDRHRRYAEDAARKQAQRQAELDAKAAKSAKGKSKTAALASKSANTPAQSNKRDPTAKATPAVVATVGSTGGQVTVLNGGLRPAADSGAMVAPPNPSPARAKSGEGPRSRAKRTAPPSVSTPSKVRPAAEKTATFLPTKATAEFAPPMRLGATTRTGHAPPRPRMASAWREQLFTAR